MVKRTREFPPLCCLSFVLIALFSLIFVPVLACADIIIDNRDAQTSQTGTWTFSGGANPYDIDSFYSRDGTTFMWHFTPPQSGIYEMSMWWTEWPSRSSNVPVDIEKYDGVTTVYIDQQVNGGQWNIQGQYYFESGTTYDITITSQPYPSSTCADAVRFQLISVNNRPTAYIDSITPSPAEPGEPVEFIGHGSDTEGPIQAYQWESSIDGLLSDLDSFTTSSLTEGTHSVSFRVQDGDGIWSEAVTATLVVGTITTTIIIDNHDAQTSQTGTWTFSGGANPYDIDSFYSRDGTTFTWHFTPPQSGIYEVSMWWTEWPSRSSNVPVDIEDYDGVTTVYIDQQENGGQWNIQGQYYFESGTSYDIMITSQPYPSSTCADAVRFQLISANNRPTAYIDSITPSPAEPGEPVEFIGHGSDTEGPIQAYQWESSIDGLLSDLDSFTTSSLTEGTHSVSFRVQDGDGIWSEAVTATLVVGTITTTIIIDNHDAQTSQTGTWTFSGGANPYDIDSFYSRDGTTFTWHFTPPQSGIYEVSMWWTEWPSRSSNVPVDIENYDGVATVYIDQQVNGGQWNIQGQFYFESGTTHNIMITSQPYPSSACADAIKFSFITDDSFVEILEPSSYYLQTFPDLTVSAVAINLEPAWKIKFIIDLGTSDERSIIDISEPYEALFTSLTEREH